MKYLSLVRSVVMVGMAAGLLAACDDLGDEARDGSADVAAGHDAGSLDAAHDAAATDGALGDAMDAAAPATDTGTAIENDAALADVASDSDATHDAAAILPDAGQDAADNVAPDAPGAGGRASEQPPTRAGLEYHGAIAIYHPGPHRPKHAAAGADDTDAGGVTAGQWLEISAPIWPKVLTLYQGEGAHYPDTADGQLALARGSALTFETLLTTCAPKYPALVLATPGGPALTDAQLDSNYRVLQDCAYQEFTAKPYWIPQLLLDVDICADQLGADWHLISEADLTGLSTDDYATIQSTLASVGGTQGFYFSGSVFALRDDGSLARGELNPAASPRFSALVSQGGGRYDPTVHNEAGIGLRCLRTTIE